MRIGKQNTKSLKILIFLFSILLFVIIPKNVVSKTFKIDLYKWEKIDTKHTVIYYQCSKDLESLNKKINLKTAQESSDIVISVSEKIITNHLVFMLLSLSVYHRNPFISGIPI